MDHFIDLFRNLFDDDPDLIPLTEMEQRLAAGDLTGRFGAGATSTQAYTRARARALFLHELWRLAPQTTTSLLDKGVVRRYKKARFELFAIMEQGDTPSLEWIDSELNGIHDRHIRQWQDRWNLVDEWVYDLAKTTFEWVTQFDKDAYTGPLMIPREDRFASVQEGKWPDSVEDPDDMLAHLVCLSLVNPIARQNIPLYLTDLQLPDRERCDSSGNLYGFVEDDGYFGTFNPRGELVNDAIQRLMPALEARLRYALERVIADDRALPGARAPVAFRTAIAFERLVCFQVNGESRNEIALADGVSRATVTEQVNDAAALIGLTLRESHGGRPRKRLDRE